MVGQKVRKPRHSLEFQMLLHNHHKKMNGTSFCKRLVPRNLREVFKKPPIETNMTKETSYTTDIRRIRHFFNSINFRFIHLNTSFRDFVPLDNTFINHKVALFPIQDKICFFTSLQNSIKVSQAIIKKVS